MVTCHCPKCDMIFRHEDADAVFCPRCETVLCELEAAAEINNEPERIPLHKKDIWPILKVLIWGVVSVYVMIFFCVFLFQDRRPLEPIGLIMFGPFWCGFSYPLLRFFVKEYSTRSGMLSLIVWLFTLGAFLMISALIYSGMHLLSNMWSWRALLSLLPGAIFAYKLGTTERFVRKLFQPVWLIRE